MTTARPEVIPKRRSQQAKQAAVKRSHLKGAIKGIAQHYDANEAEDEWAEAAVQPEGERQTKKREQRESLKEVEDDCLVTTKRAQTQRRRYGGEERKAAWRCDSRHQRSDRANAIK